MNRNWKMMVPLVSLAFTIGIGSAQTEQPEPAANVISGTVAAIGYPVGGMTRVNMMGTAAASQASGEAKVEARNDGTDIELKVSSMPQPTTLGAEFLTFVLWTVTPDGTTRNLGEIVTNKNGEARLDVKAQSQTFALIVTAEPYYAVSMPSEAVVLVNETRNNTRGKIYPDNSYKLMKSAVYIKSGNPLALTPDLDKVPLDMYEARNAVEIAKSRGAEQFAPEVLAKAQSSLQSAEDSLAHDAGKNQLISVARQTIQYAEDARALAARREQTARIEKEKQAAAAAAAEKAKTEAEAQAAAEAKRQAELTAAKEAEMKAQAAAQSAEQKAAADIAAAKAAAAAAAEQAALQAKADAAKQEAANALAATAALRAQLLKQLNEVLQTTETSQGLVVRMADVLFKTGKYALNNQAQLKLAKLSGIIQAHPGLILAIDGYTDNTGTPQFNMNLSQQRADSVRQFLITQGLAPATISSTGLGQADPIADNSTAAGRTQNRRVNIIVSGKVIGINIDKQTTQVNIAAPAPAPAMQSN
jgi:outer membrane protein OmpA-like peptidoglycan-associated protein